MLSNRNTSLLRRWNRRQLTRSGPNTRRPRGPHGGGGREGRRGGRRGARGGRRGGGRGRGLAFVVADAVLEDLAPDAAEVSSLSADEGLREDLAADDEGVPDDMPADDAEVFGYGAQFFQS